MKDFIKTILIAGVITYYGKKLLDQSRNPVRDVQMVPETPDGTIDNGSVLPSKVSGLLPSPRTSVTGLNHNTLLTL